MNIIHKPLNKNITKLIKARTPKYIVIHYTAGSSSKKGQAEMLHYVFSSSKSSADFGVDDETIVQLNPDIKNYYCWAVGGVKSIWSKGGSLYQKCTNKNSISIEMCSTNDNRTLDSLSKVNHKHWSFTDKVINNTIELVKHLMKEYNIPISNVIRHYDVTGKNCPGVLGWNGNTIYEYSNNILKATNKYNTEDQWLKFKERLK